MQVTVHHSIAEFDAADWRRLDGTNYPFLSHEFLALGESSGCVSAATGWQPMHLALRDGSRLIGAMPLYAKSHSWGEFVFDWAWAEAYERAGLAYYPKLVSAAPFTPAPAPKLLLRDRDDDAAAAALLAAARQQVESGKFSSLHIQFPDERDAERAAAAGLMLRRDCQFHWHNRGYRDFEDFLAGFSAAKRKKVRRERRRVREAGLSFRHLAGGELDAGLWAVVHALISTTFAVRGSLPYYDLDFFQGLGSARPEDLLVILAEDPGRTPVAAAVCYRGVDRLYGRYWGSRAYYDSLHFETCYYQGIDYCIRHGIAVFEPGTQGEHKIARGFTPVSTVSAHWLAEPRFNDAVSRYLDAEGRQVDRYIAAVEDHLPYRRGEPDDA